MDESSRQKRLPGMDMEPSDLSPAARPGRRAKRGVRPQRDERPEGVESRFGEGASPTEAASAATTADPLANPEPSPTAMREVGSIDAVGTPEAPAEGLQGRTVWVIDAHSLIHQVFHALPEMTSPRGEPVGAVFGFCRDIFYLWESKKPDYLFAAFDLPGKTFRHELFDQYKIQRPEMHVDLVPQIAAIRRLLDALGVPALACESFEADDILATVARVTDESGARCFLVTGDKDCRQLITDRVAVYNIRKDRVFDRESLRAEWGIAPEQVVDFQALVGDSVDNVPGISLIGPKLAQHLLEKYGTLEQVLDHAGEVSGDKRKQNLLAGRQQAFLSRELVRLNSNVPIAIDWEAGRPGQIDRPRALEMFREFGFRSLAVKMEAEAGIAVAGASRSETTYHLVDSTEAIEAFVDQLSLQKRISVDTETTSISPRWAELVGLSFAWRDDEAWYLPVRAPEGEPHLDLGETLEALRPILEDPGVEKIGQNLKYDMVVLRGAGVRLAGVAFDTMVASYLLDAGQRNHNLDDLAKRYLDHTTIKISELIGTGKKQKRMDEVPVRQVADYAGEDAVLPMRLEPMLGRKLDQTGLRGLMDDLETPLVEVLAEMEYQGIKVDTGRLQSLSGRFAQQLAELEQQIYDLAGHSFNISSPKQLQEVLFTELKLPPVRKTSTGQSTDADVLEELAGVHPLPAKIIEHRQVAKLKGTYVDALPALVHPTTGRVHASFNQVVAATGRLSSSDPNLQNIPVRTEAGREIRSAFVPGEEGWLLLAADYSQIELRVLAHYSGDQRLCEAFARDEDIHARVAAQVFGVPLEGVTADMRRRAKTVNFGVIYGQTPFGLSRQLGIDKQEAARFIDAYFAGYPGIEGFLNRVLSECSEKGYVKTILGRRRAISGVRPDAGRNRNLAERTAVNTVIQGSAADLIKLAMIAIHRRLKQENFRARMLLQIHDELMFEVPEEELDRLGALVTEEMSGAYTLDVPLKVDVKVGPNWADAKAVGSWELGEMAPTPAPPLPTPNPQPPTAP